MRGCRARLAMRLAIKMKGVSTALAVLETDVIGLHLIESK